MIVNEPTDARVMIVDDEPANVLLLEKLLARRGFSQIKGTTDSGAAAVIFEAFRPDIVLLDLHMPGLDGFGVLGELSARIGSEDLLPVVILTADTDPETKLRALAAGAQDFLTKPLDHAEILARIRNLVRLRALHRQLISDKGLLEQRVALRTRELHDTQIDVLMRLGRTAEYRDDLTGQHTYRVGELSARIAAMLGQEPADVEMMREAAPLHDIGKVGIPDSILLKAGKLTQEEWAVMKTHTRIGADILGGSPHRLLQLASEIALTHHERHDGSGYMGLAGNDIPLSGRIVAVADVYDALTHERPYKPAWSMAEATREIVSQRNRQFDAGIVDAFMAVLEVSVDRPVREGAIGARDAQGA